MDKPLDKEAIRKALEAASPGPWVPYWDGVVQFFNVPNGAYMFPADDFEREDAHLIANTPTWLRALLDGYERMEKELQGIGVEQYYALQNKCRELQATNKRLTEERDKYHKLAAELATEQKYAKEQAIKWNDRAIQAEQERDAYREALEYIGHGPIGVFGEGFGWDFHYKKLRDHASRTLTQYSKGEETHDSE